MGLLREYYNAYGSIRKTISRNLDLGKIYLNVLFNEWPVTLRSPLRNAIIIFFRTDPKCFLKKSISLFIHGPYL